VNTRGLGEQLAITVRLYFRNTMALVYGYAFPLIFLIAFWVLYRYDRVPLVRHMGELLTIAVLGGACFGLPTSMVSDRERGVWRRYRLTPSSTATLVTSTVLARYLILITAGLLQVGLAVALGMPWPRHPAELLVAFSFVCFAFLGLGLVIAMLADNVPAVQALGQCIFLPMLIIGGIAVRLDALPEWAQHLSAFFPGRYAVDVIQASVSGDGLRHAGFGLFALALIGAAGCLAAAKMFRWDSAQRFSATSGKAWVGVALAAWIAVGVLAERRGDVIARIAVGSDEASVNLADIVVSDPSNVPTAVSAELSSPPALEGAAAINPETVAPDSGRALPSVEPGAASAAEATAPVRAPAHPPDGPAQPAAPAEDASRAAGPAPGESATIGPPRWQDVTLATIEREILFDRLPPDNGVVTPVASAIQEPNPDLYEDLDTLAGALPTWAPGLVSDPVQKVRNLLYVAAVVDIYQLPTEAYVPAIVFAQIEETVPKDTLIKVLFWIAVHRDEGDHSAVDNMQPLGLGNGPSDIAETRGRAAVYAVKLLGRLTGKRPGR
jgi:ABC-2 type transport system permease protein